MSGVVMPGNRCTPTRETGAGVTPNLDTTPEYTPGGINDELKEIALNLAALGFHVGPLDGKRPRTKHGFKDFTRNLFIVEEWWQQYPNANIGARVPKGWVVLDIDPRNGGNETWEEITAVVSLPKTLVVRTGSGGKHYWFKLPYDAPTRSTAGPGIDIKTHTGYLVMPGSIHPETGKQYVIDTTVGPKDVAVLPSGLCPYVYKARNTRPWITTQPPRTRPALVAGPQDPNKRRAGLVNKVRNAPEGERNSLLYWAACLNYEENLGCEQELRDAALANGLPELEIQRTLQSAHARKGGTPNP